MSMAAEGRAPEDELRQSLGTPPSRGLHRSSSASNSKASSLVHFGEVAHSVSLQLLKDPKMLRSPPKAGLRISRPSSSAGGDGAQEKARGSARDLPLLEANPYKIRCNMEWLKAESKAEKSKVRKLESSLSESVLQEQAYQKRVHKQQEMLEGSQHRLVDMQQKMKSLTQELQSAEKLRKERLSEFKGPKGAQASHGRSSLSTTAPPEAGTTLGSTDATARGLDLAEDDLEATAELTNILSPDQPDTRRSRERRSILLNAADWPASDPATPISGRSGRLALPREGSDEEQQLAEQGGPTLEEYFAAGDALQLPLAGSRSRGATAPARASPASRNRTTRDSSRVGTAADRKQQMEEAKEAERRRAEHCRQLIRDVLIDKAGDARTAFKNLDLSRTGRLTCLFFADCLSCEGVNWQAITGLTRQRDIFKFFDEDGDAVITYKELFPDENHEEIPRASTPEFLRRYKGMEVPRSRSTHFSRPSNLEDMLNLQKVDEGHNEAHSERSKWILSTLRRLKKRGKSDARCREVVAKHLPRGTGPPDQEGVGTFSLHDLKACKKRYQDEWQVPMRNMNKAVADFKEQRREAKRIYDKLFVATEARKMQEEQVAAQAALGGLSFGAPKDVAHEKGKPKPLSLIAQENELDEKLVQGLQKTFSKYDNNWSECITRKGFVKILGERGQGKSFDDEKVSEMWSEALSQKGGDSKKEGNDPLGGLGDMMGGALGGLVAGQNETCTFEQFVLFYIKSELYKGGGAA